MPRIILGSFFLSVHFVWLTESKVPSLKLTASSHLKIDGKRRWFMSFRDLPVVRDGPSSLHLWGWKHPSYPSIRPIIKATTLFATGSGAHFVDANLSWIQAVRTRSSHEDLSNRCASELPVIGFPPVKNLDFHREKLKKNEYSEVILNFLPWQITIKLYHLGNFLSFFPSTNQYLKQI